MEPKVKLRANGRMKLLQRLYIEESPHFFLSGNRHVLIKQMFHPICIYVFIEETVLYTLIMTLYMNMCGRFCPACVFTFTTKYEIILEKTFLVLKIRFH